jgi:16S rRNA (guanine1207-N2)-methyltransferase
VAAVDLGWGDVPWVSYPGTFAAGGLDDGTALLLEHLPTVEAGDAVVDFGAGTGVLAAAVAHRAPGARICLVEPDAPSREAAGENVPGGEFLPVSGWEEHGPFQMVVSNPPYHDGKAETLDVVRALVAGSARGLVERGELRLVVQRRLPVEEILASSFGVVAGVADRGPHRVWRAADPHPRI